MLSGEGSALNFIGICDEWSACGLTFKWAVSLGERHKLKWRVWCIESRVMSVHGHVCSELWKVLEQNQKEFAL